MAASVAMEVPLRQALSTHSFRSQRRSIAMPPLYERNVSNPPPSPNVPYTCRTRWPPPRRGPGPRFAQRQREVRPELAVPGRRFHLEAVGAARRHQHAGRCATRFVAAVAARSGRRTRPSPLSARIATRSASLSLTRMRAPDRAQLDGARLDAPHGDGPANRRRHQLVARRRRPPRPAPDTDRSRRTSPTDDAVTDPLTASARQLAPHVRHHDVARHGAQRHARVLRHRHGVVHFGVVGLLPRVAGPHVHPGRTLGDLDLQLLQQRPGLARRSGARRASPRRCARRRR